MRLFVRRQKPNGYTRKSGHAYFPGLCKWTGYCADDDMIQHVWKRMKPGDSLTDALESLADVARQHFESDLEQAQEEESMLANWGGQTEWTIDGERFRR